MTENRRQRRQQLEELERRTDNLMSEIEGLGRPRRDPGVAGTADNPLGYLLMGGPGAQGGLRAASTNVTHDDGSVHRVINIGVPSDHPMAAP